MWQFFCHMMCVTTWQQSAIVTSCVQHDIKVLGFPGIVNYLCLLLHDSKLCGLMHFLQFEWRMEEGDMLSFNNRRVCHSRNGFVMNGGTRHLKVQHCLGIQFWRTGLLQLKQFLQCWDMTLKLGKYRRTFDACACPLNLQLRHSVGILRGLWNAPLSMGTVTFQSTL